MTEAIAWTGENLLRTLVLARLEPNKWVCRLTQARPHLEGTGYGSTPDEAAKKALEDL